MFAFLDSPVEIGIVVLVILLLFGGSQLPKLAKNLGQAQKEFKDGLSAGQREEAQQQAAAAAAASAATAPPVTSTPTSTPTSAVTDAERAEELRRLEARMAELKGDQPRSTEI